MPIAHIGDTVAKQNRGQEQRRRSRPGRRRSIVCRKDHFLMTCDAFREAFQEDSSRTKDLREGVQSLQELLGETQGR